MTTTIETHDVKSIDQARWLLNEHDPSTEAVSSVSEYLESIKRTRLGGVVLSFAIFLVYWLSNSGEVTLSVSAILSVTSGLVLLGSLSGEHFFHKSSSSKRSTRIDTVPAQSPVKWIQNYAILTMLASIVLAMFVREGLTSFIALYSFVAIGLAMGALQVIEDRGSSSTSDYLASVDQRIRLFGQESVLYTVAGVVSANFALQVALFNEVPLEDTYEEVLIAVIVILATLFVFWCLGRSSVNMFIQRLFKNK